LSWNTWCLTYEHTALDELVNVWDCVSEFRLLERLFH